ncbi:hypothetical protein MLD38_039049 [Melastoma candidum]|uniref:Uncharacterized protein n=1 Tax=Melastoma candidum TaxID=119954 RepID=A0ACB9L0V1_9MYRT|nr:hypothetical protein MLD38_039049 [Melastoma candidum]
MEMKSASSSSNPNRPGLRQVFLRIPNGSTLSLLLPNANVSISSLKHFLFRRTHVPPSSQLLSLCGRVLPDTYHAPIPPNSTLSLSIRLFGGKGGFGSLLRGAATKAGQKKTSNFDACRDMSGRRLRHVNAEKKLEEWRAEEEQRRLEKMAEEFLKQNAKKAEKKGAGKSGDAATDKYVLKYREDSAKCIERVEECVKEVVGKRKIGKAIVPGGGDSKKLKIWMGKRKLEESDSGSEDDEDNERSVVSYGVPQPNSTGEQEGSPDSVTGGSRNQNGSAFGSSISSSEEEKDAVSLATSDCGGCSGQQGILKKEEENLDLEISNASGVYPVSEEKACEPMAKSSGSCQLVDHDGGVICPHGDEQITEAVQAFGEADTRSESQLGIFDEKPLDFDQYHSSSEMEALGMERLKMELQSHGLKCGGTLQERAARLFLLKSLSLDQIPKKHLAKK